MILLAGGAGVAPLTFLLHEDYSKDPSPQRAEITAYVVVLINGPLGKELFAFAEKTGLSFEIHYEIEDSPLPPLEEMLGRYPRAKVIWCHLAQIRYSGRSSVYGPAYVRGLLEKYPNLHIDVAFGDSFSKYPGSNESSISLMGRQPGFW